ncbi:hypothetical protein AVEN_94027-1, partial [Araneus ventricosus]
MELCIVSYRSRWSRFPTASLSQTEEDPDGVFPLSASEVGARLREEPLRCRGGKKATRTEPQSHRNT